MSVNTESEREKRKIGWIELIRELATRLKEEITLLAFLFALVVALTAISTPHYSIWVAITFIALYFIAVGCYFALKTKRTGVELRGEPKEYIAWTVRYPLAFQNPKFIEEKQCSKAFQRRAKGSSEKQPTSPLNT